jgi:transcription termination/antitermination protein NusA
MARVKLDRENFGLSALFEKVTKCRVKDCFREEDLIYVIVAPGEMGKALGKGGETVKKVQQQLGKRIKVIEFRESPEDFLRNVIFPVKVEEIAKVDGAVVIRDSNRKTKGLLMGRNGKNLQVIKRAVSRFFDMDVRIE